MPKNLRRGAVVVLMLLCLLALILIGRAVLAQVYFEPTTTARARAHSGAHDQRVWGGVLAAAAFVATVLTERVAPLLGVVTGLLALVGFSTALFVLVPVDCCVVVGVLAVELARPDGRS